MSDERTSEARAPKPGPIDVFPWPDHLTARVCTADAPARVHGYDLGADLAARYSFAEMAALAVTGELPTEASGRALEVCLAFLMPAPVSTAATNTAVLARGIGTPYAGALAAGLSTLTRQASSEARRVEALLETLASGEPVQAAGGAGVTEEAEAVQTLARALDRANVPRPDWGEAPSLLEAVVVVLYGCGVRTPRALQALLVMARLPVLAAEAAATPRLSFFDYPLRVPDYRYEPEATDE